jgi:glycosyltransferase involved in cell wall biosynthesis
MRILFLNHVAPFPPFSGGDIRTYHLVRRLASRHEVTVVGFRSGRRFHYPPFPVRVIEVPYQTPPLWRQMHGSDKACALEAAERLATCDEPWFVSCMASPTMTDALRDLGRQRFDLAVIEHTDMARFLPDLPAGLPCVMNLHNVHALMAQREATEKTGADAERAQREAERTRRFESWAVGRCDVSLAMSDAEADAARRLLGCRDVRVVPNGVDTRHFLPGAGPGEEGHLLFAGSMGYGPNVEAVQHFVSGIWPLVRREVPEATFHIVGAQPAPEVEALAGDGVEVHGRVPDMGPYFRQAAVVVVPLLHGGGTRLKILEAAASARAVVSTPFGAEGLDLRDGQELLLADAPADFARAVVGLLRDPRRRLEMGRHARRAAQRYDWEGIGSTLLDIVAEVGGRSVPSGERPRVAPPPGVARRYKPEVRGRFFLVGCPRSGTTLLQSMLAAHPRLASFPESHFFTSLVPAHLQPCTAGVAARSARRDFHAYLKRIDRPELGRRLTRRAHLMRQFVRRFVGILDELATERGKDHWLEKTPDHLHVIASIEKYLPAARFIHLLRRGEDVVASLYDVTKRYPQHWHGSWGIDRCIDEWSQDVSRSIECRGRPNHYFVRYEDLLADPAAVLRELCDFLGLAYDPAMMERQAASAAAVVLPDEPWKVRATEGLQTNRPSRFAAVFTPGEQARIRARLVNLDDVFPPRFAARDDGSGPATPARESRAGFATTPVEDGAVPEGALCS